jgi:hypothetical protein
MTDPLTDVYARAHRLTAAILTKEYAPALYEGGGCLS